MYRTSLIAVSFMVLPRLSLILVLRLLRGRGGPRCLKITEKVSFNIASEASYVYILDGQQFIFKNAKNGPFLRLFENLKLAVKQCYKQVSFKIAQKLVANARIQKFKCDILSNFQTMWGGAYNT